jgi:hypothetical protein
MSRQRDPDLRPSAYECSVMNARGMPCKQAMAGQRSVLIAQFGSKPGAEVETSEQLEPVTMNGRPNGLLSKETN